MFKLNWIQFHWDISIEENSSDEYILEVGLEYLDGYCSSTANKYDIKIGGVNKLVPSLGNKSR